MNTCIIHTEKVVQHIGCENHWREFITYYCKLILQSGFYPGAGSATRRVNLYLILFRPKLETLAIDIIKYELSYM